MTDVKSGRMGNNLVQKCTDENLNTHDCLLYNLVEECIKSFTTEGKSDLTNLKDFMDRIQSHDLGVDVLSQFYAETDCAVLDVLAPPYNYESGRPCNYYRLVSDCKERPDPSKIANETFKLDPNSKLGQASATTMWLLACEAPQEFYTVRRAYTGPPLDRYRLKKGTVA
eukprot:746636-Hanusia_phi.AAC.1